MVIVFIYISGTSATVQVEVGDNASQTVIPVATVTTSSVVVLGLPVSQIATNVTVISRATVNTSYRSYVGGEPPSNPVAVYTNGVLVPPTMATDATNAGKKLAQGQLATSATDIYAAPANKRARIDRIVIVNTDTVLRTFKLWHGGSADTNVIVPTTNLLVGGWAEMESPMVLENSDSIKGIASVASELTYTVYGAETQFA